MHKQSIGFGNHSYHLLFLLLSFWMVYMATRHKKWDINLISHLNNHQ